jgi:hypothetical protein
MEGAAEAAPYLTASRSRLQRTICHVIRLRRNVDLPHSSALVGRRLRLSFCSALLVLPARAFFGRAWIPIVGWSKLHPKAWKDLLNKGHLDPQQLESLQAAQQL